MTYKPGNYQSFKKKQKRRKVYQPLIFGGLAIIMIAIGLTLVFLSFNGAGISLSFLYTETPTPSFTPTQPPATETPTITPTGTITPTPTDAPTSTASAPFTYVVQSGDSLSSIALQFDIEDPIIIMVMNGITDQTVLFPGDELLIPDPNSGLPTPTNIPPNLRRGDIIDYMVLPGDTAQLIAEKFLSTVDGILDASQDEYGSDFDINTIYPGQILKVPVRLITPTFGPPATETPTNTPGAAATETPTATATVAP